MKKKMMIKLKLHYKLFTAAVLICLWAVSCNDLHDHNSQDSISAHNHAEHSNTVALNNNEKWKANEETNIGIANMMHLVKNEKNNGYKNDCTQLQSKLNEEFDQIFKKCTMKGEAHNQLHNYLMPLSAYIERLDLVDEKECLANLNNLEKYLAEYSNYFE